MSDLCGPDHTGPSDPRCSYYRQPVLIEDDDDVTMLRVVRLIPAPPEPPEMDW